MENECKQNILIGIFLAIMAYLCFAISSSCIKALNDFPIIESVFFQQFISLLIIAPYALRGKAIHFSKNNLGVHFTRSVSGILSFITYYFAIQHWDLIDATLISYTTPFFTPFVWKLWSKEKFEKEVLWSVIIGFLGITIILKPSSNLIQIPALMGILSAILSALALSSIRVLNLRKESPIRTLFYFFLVGSIMMLPLALIYWRTPNILEWACLIGVGSSMALAQIFLTIAYKHSSPPFLSPMSYSMIIFTAFIGWFYFDCDITVSTILGAILIITGGLITLYLRQRSLKKAKSLSKPEP